MQSICRICHHQTVTVTQHTLCRIVGEGRALVSLKAISLVPKCVKTVFAAYNGVQIMPLLLINNMSYPSDHIGFHGDGF